MKIANDWYRSKTTWTAIGALGYALADVAAKGTLTWHSALIALIGVMGATIRDTLAKGHEQARVSDEVFGRTLEATSAAARATTGLTTVLTGLTARPRPFSVTEEEMDGEADRD